MKKISRKDIAKMSTKEMMSASKEPYRKLWGYMKPYRGRFIGAMFFGVLCGLLNGVLVHVVRHVSATVFPGGGNFKSHSDTPIHVIVSIAMLIPAIMLARAIFAYINGYLMTWVSLRVLDDIRGDLFKKLLGQSMEFFNKQKGGDLMQLVFNQTRVAQQAITTVSSDLVKEPIAILSALAVMFWHDWRFSLCALVLFPLCIIPVVIVSKKVRKAGAQEEEEAGNMNVIMQEAFAGIRLVKSNSREDYEVARFNESNNRMLRSMMRWRRALEGVGQLVEVTASLGVAAALVYIWLYQKRAEDFIALNGALVMLYPPAKALSRVPIQMQKCLAATTKIFEAMDRPVKVQDKPDAVQLAPAAGRIVFDQVSFAYGKDKAALREFNLTIEPGQRVALVGPSGAGKSTVFSLLLRLYDPDTGSISVAGHDIRDLSQQSFFMIPFTKTFVMAVSMPPKKKSCRQHNAPMRTISSRLIQKVISASSVIKVLPSVVASSSGSPSPEPSCAMPQFSC
jgi:ATP-binding cassette, subfamily B, bacterial MsbA